MRLLPLLSLGQAYFVPRNDKHPHPALSPQGRGEKDKNNLLVIAPTSSGKTFIGEMAATTQVIHQKKVIYLVPLRYLAEQKYRHFKNLYSNWGLETAASTRDHREDDRYIYRTGLTFADIENMGGRARILNIGKEGNCVRNKR